MLLRYDTYRRLSGEQGGSIVELLRQDGDGADFDFAPPRIGDIARPAVLD
ncbi:hypothetical protein [Azospirillum brasilense]|nr:hypothetical protein [Azospirillum brasilense]